MSNAPISRRNFMQQSALWAAAFAGAGTMGTGQALAAREKELNILCWEGYNSAQVLDPFRSSREATVKAESLTNDPTMINRLRAGENMQCAADGGDQTRCDGRGAVSRCAFLHQISGQRRATNGQARRNQLPERTGKKSEDRKPIHRKPLLFE